MFTVLSVNLIGDWLRDLLDPDCADEADQSDLIRERIRRCTMISVTKIITL